MAAETDNTRSTTTPWKAAAVGVVAVCAIAVLWLFLAARPTPSPRGLSVVGSPPDLIHGTRPDLSGCTRIEIRYLPYTLGYPVWENEAEKGLLSPDEVQHVDMLLQAVMDDPEYLRTFAQMIASGSYVGTNKGGVGCEAVATVLCRFDDRPPIRFMVYGDSLLVTEDKQVFDCRAPLGTLTKISSQVRSSRLLPQIRLRIRCARNLDYLYAGLRGFGDQVAYPSPSTWCDTVMQRCLAHGDTVKEVRRSCVCPATTSGNCDYAMNPNCKPDSPSDTVLLFEARAGWNQDGGPDLFTSGNHDPRGGLLLLNDGSMRFIRTEEELKQLRWK